MLQVLTTVEKVACRRVLCPAQQTKASAGLVRGCCSSGIQPVVGVARRIRIALLR